MSLLVLDRVSKRYPRGERGVHERVALRDVSLEVVPGELVGVFGRRRSGRTTLLRVAAGVESPSDGTVRFAGADLADRPMVGRRDGIALGSSEFARTLGQTVLEHVTAPLAADLRAGDLSALGRGSLRRTGVEHVEDLVPDELEDGDAMRVAIARALITRPRLLLLDDPLAGLPPASERDRLLELVASIAHDDGIAVLMTVDEAVGLAGSDRALTIDAGEVRGGTAVHGAPVVPIR